MSCTPEQCADLQHLINTLQAMALENAAQVEEKVQQLEALNLEADEISQMMTTATAWWADCECGMQAAAPEGADPKKVDLSPKMKAMVSMQLRLMRMARENPPVVESPRKQES